MHKSIFVSVRRDSVMNACPVPFLDINSGLAELNHGSCFVLLPKVDFNTGKNKKRNVGSAQGYNSGSV